MRHPRRVPAAELTYRGRRLCALLDLVAVHLAVEVLLVVEPASPVLLDQRSATGGERTASAAPNPCLTCSKPDCRPTILLDPTGQGADALQASAPGSVVAHPVPAIRATLVLRARHDVTRDLLPTATLIAELAQSTLEGAASPARPLPVEPASLVRTGR